jgi:hypothetical protein
MAAPIAAPPSREVSGAGQVSVAGKAAGKRLALSLITTAPRSAVPLAPTPGNSQANGSLAIDDVMAEFGVAGISKSFQGLALSLDTTLDGLVSEI